MAPALVLLAAAVSVAVSPEPAVISPSTPVVDEAGNPVQAHSAGIILPSSHPAGAGEVCYMAGSTQTKPGS